MPISCLPTETSYDVQCPVCGSGFMLLTAPNHAMQSGPMRQAARKALANQHRRVNAPTRAHPDGVFELQGWDGMVNASDLPSSLFEPTPDLAT